MSAPDNAKYPHSGIWSFYAIGTAGPQGSKRHLGNGVMAESSKKVKPWRDSVTAAAFGAGECLDGPLIVRMVFTLSRPKAAPKRLTVPDTYPDLSKLARSTEDAITAAGLWQDDARVSEYQRLAKVWTDYDNEALPVPGVVVTAATLDMADQIVTRHNATLSTAWARYQKGSAA